MYKIKCRIIKNAHRRFLAYFNIIYWLSEHRWPKWIRNAVYLLMVVNGYHLKFLYRLFFGIQFNV